MDEVDVVPKRPVAPVIGVITVRTPAALRPKVMTAVMTVATIAGPIGFFGAGEVLRWISVQTLFVLVATAMTVGALAFAAALLRGGAASGRVAMPDVAHG